MHTLSGGISYLDLNFVGRPRVIASAVLQHPSGVAIVDPGPSTTLPVLERELGAAGIEMGDVTTLILTHIHLDHAGATGTLVARNPKLRVFVHEKGAPHLVEPAKLIASAARLYGADMERLWGEIRPVPADALRVLTGGETIDAGGRRWDVAYTPGHASHHLSYFNRDCGIAFVGDTAGVKLQASGYILPPTPPPDIDIEAWRASIARIESWRPDTLFLTHFGPCGPPDAHLAALRENMDEVVAIGRASLAREGDDSSREAWFSEELTRTLKRQSGENADSFEAAARFDLCWRGLARYLRPRA